MFLPGMIKRLGIFGGAFDPVHKGHTQSLKYISDLKIIDEIQVIPNYASPHNKDIQTDEKHRLKMLEIAFKQSKNIKLNDIELKNQFPYHPPVQVRLPSAQPLRLPGPLSPRAAQQA